LCAAAFCGVLLVGAVAAHAEQTAQSPAQLLARYAPILVLHPQERFAPEPVEGFIADSDLVGGNYEQRSCNAVDGTAALACYSGASMSHAPKPTLYGAATRSANRIVLQYWLFYYYNLYSFPNPLGPLWQAHEGDWEAVAVVLDTAQKPLFVGLSQHCAGARRQWAKVERRGDRPLVYVALGSHANFFAPGLQSISSRCLPPEAAALLRQYNVTLTDQVARGRKIVAASNAPITARTPEWMTFAGTWGEAQYVQIPNQAPIASGRGPQGPAFHALWRKPVATLLGWPSG
jgi:hypothetical protein